MGPYVELRTRPAWPAAVQACFSLESYSTIYTSVYLLCTRAYTDFDASIHQNGDHAVYQWIWSFVAKREVHMSDEQHACMLFLVTNSFRYVDRFYMKRCTSSCLYDVFMKTRTSNRKSRHWGAFFRAAASRASSLLFRKFSGYAGWIERARERAHAPGGAGHKRTLVEWAERADEERAAKRLAATV